MDNLQNEKPADEFLLTFADLLFIVKKNKRKIGFFCLVFALLALFYGLTKPIVYEAEATFKEKGKSQSGLNTSLSSAFFMMSNNSDSNALTIMQSRMLIENLIREQNLQGILVKQEFAFPLASLQKIKNNLLVEYAYYKNFTHPVLNETPKNLYLETIAYHREVPKNLLITVVSKDKYLLHDELDKEGYFDQPFFGKDYSFTLKADRTPVAHDQYAIMLLPLEQTAEMMSKQFKIELDKFDKNLLRISYSHPDRQIAANNVNALMALYLKHIECEHEEICEKQIDYLLKRQKNMAETLEAMMKSHAENLSQDLSSTGFISSEWAMNFLAGTQQELKVKSITLNQEIQRLEKAKDSASIDNDVFISLNNLEVINKLATEKRHLKQQADSLTLLLLNTPSRTEEFNASFSAQMDQLKSISQSIGETEIALMSLQKNQSPNPLLKLPEDSKYIFDIWNKKLMQAAQERNNNPGNRECLYQWEQCNSGFAAYLTNINHFLNMSKRNIEEKLAHRQAPLKEFQGIDLNVAKDLYISYNKELSNAESLATQHEFISEQLDDQDFEISSLSTILTDPLSLAMITRTSDLILALKDQDNRSSKEQERLHTDLGIQKGFIKTHIRQSIALLTLRQKFLKEKIQHLQSLSLSLIQEQISILENQINEYIANTLEKLNQEKQLIEKNLSEMRIEMAAFPQKWVSEQLIDQQMEINKKLVEEISKLVESKNISNNLEKLQSTPVDIAYPPIHPKSPRLVLLTAIGAALGAFLSFVWLLGQSVMRGVQASPENLKSAGQYVCGTLTWNYKGSFKEDPLLDHDLETLRRLVAFIEPTKSDVKKHNTLLLLQGNGPNYTASLAELMSLKGYRVLIMELYFDEGIGQESKGIIQYLEGKIEAPAIAHYPAYDKIMSGGASRFASELIGSQKFKDLYQSVKEKYDWIFVCSHAKPKNAETIGLLDLFPNAVVSISDEILQDLTCCIRHANDPGSKIAFIFTHAPQSLP